MLSRNYVLHIRLRTNFLSDIKKKDIQVKEVSKYFEENGIPQLMALIKPTIR